MFFITWDTALCKFKLYHVMTWHTDTVKWLPKEAYLISIVSYIFFKKKKNFFFFLVKTLRIYPLNFQILLTVEQCKFELCRSTYMLVFSTVSTTVLFDCWLIEFVDLMWTVHTQELHKQRTNYKLYSNFPLCGGTTNPLLCKSWLYFICQSFEMQNNCGFLLFPGFYSCLTYT